MSGAVSHDQAADQQAEAVMTAEADGGHRRGRRRWVAVGVVIVLVAAAGAAIGVTGAFAKPSHPSTGSGVHTSVATVQRRSLSAQTQVDATLGRSGSYSVVNQASGTLTALPAVGTVALQGQVLYRVSGAPVVLLYGPVPAYRDLSDGLTGPDVTELNADLVRLGYATSAQLDPRSDYFSLATAYALEKLQARLGVTVTGSLTLGQAAFLPGPLQVTALATGIVLGGTATPGSVLMTATSTMPVVTIALDPAQQTEIKVGERVTVTLPDGQNTPGVVSSVGTVATTSGGSGGTGTTATIPVQVTLINPKAAGNLSSAPVQVTITTGSVQNTLVVPVDALLAQTDGGYAVEVISGHGHHLVAVTPGVFDDAAGLVQVSGTSLSAGQHIVVPAT